MVENKKSFLDNIVKNVVFKIVQFIVFSLITSTPYLINNLDKVSAKVSAGGAVGFYVIFSYIEAILGSIWIGMGIGLSTLYFTLTHLSQVFGDFMIGTILYSLIVLIFATLTFMQPIHLLFQVLSHDKEPSIFLAFLVALILTVIVASPICHLLNDGQTITSGLIEDKGNQTISQTNINDTLPLQQNASNEDKIVNSINMLTGGE